MKLSKKGKTLFFLLSFAFIANSHAQDIYEGTYQWRIPGGQYIDPVSFFSLHGYVNGVYASASEQWKQGNMNGIGKANSHPIINKFFVPNLRAKRPVK